MGPCSKLFDPKDTIGFSGKEICARFTRVPNQNDLPEVSGGESRNKRYVNRQVYETEFVIDRTVVHVFKDETYSFRVRLYRYFSGDDF